MRHHGTGNPSSAPLGRPRGLELAAQYGKVPTRRGLERDFSLRAWENHRGELALAVDDEVWDIVRLAYSEFALAVGILEHRAQEAEPSASEELPDFPGNYRQMFPVTADRMKAARDMLLAARRLTD